MFKMMIALIAGVLISGCSWRDGTPWTKWSTVEYKEYELSDVISVDYLEGGNFDAKEYGAGEGED